MDPSQYTVSTQDAGTGTDWMSTVNSLNNLVESWWVVLHQPTVPKPPAGTPTGTLTTAPGSVAFSLSTPFLLVGALVLIVLIVLIVRK
jgi:hypothetical protein